MMAVYTLTMLIVLAGGSKSNMISTTNQRVCGNLLIFKLRYQQLNFHSHTVVLTGYVRIPQPNLATLSTPTEYYRYNYISPRGIKTETWSVFGILTSDTIIMRLAQYLSQQNATKPLRKIPLLMSFRRLFCSRRCLVHYENRAVNSASQFFCETGRRHRAPTRKYI